MIVKPRREAGIGSNPQRDILMRVAERAWRAFDPQEVAALARVDAQDRRRGRPALERCHRINGYGAKDISQRGEYGFALLRRQPIEMSVPHGFMLITQCSTAENGVSPDRFGRTDLSMSPAHRKSRRKPYVSPAAFWHQDSRSDARLGGTDIRADAGRSRRRRHQDRAAWHGR